MFTLRAKLAHLAIVSWAVPAERLAELLPSQLVPNTIDDAGKIGVFSMAAMRDTTLDESYAQLNERTYVRRRDGTGEGAFFWKSHAASRQADLFRWLLGIPEFHDAVDLTFDSRSITFAQTLRAARSLHTSSKKSLWMLKKKEMRGAKASTSSPRWLRAATVPPSSPPKPKRLPWPLALSAWVVTPAEMADSRLASIAARYGMEIQQPAG